MTDPVRRLGIAITQQAAENESGRDLERLERLEQFERSYALFLKLFSRKGRRRHYAAIDK